MNKKFLKLELDFDFILLSITSQLKDYRLCYQINKVLNFDFKKIDDLEINYAGGKIMYHSCYIYFIEDITAKYYIISNRGTEGLLVPELKGTDYFVLIKEFIDDEDLEHFIKEAKGIEDIQAIVELDPRKLKSKENLIF